MAPHRSSQSPLRGWTSTRTRTHLAVGLVALLAVTGVVVGSVASMPERETDPDAGPVQAVGTVAPAVPELSVGPTDAPPRKQERADGRRGDDGRRSGLAGRVEALIDSGKIPAKRRGRSGSRLPRLVTPTDGRAGTGLALGVMDAVVAPVGGPVTGTVSTSVANVPNRTSASGFAASLRAVTAEGQDFVMLNEVSARSLDTIRSTAPAYGAYRDPVPDPTQGGSQSMNNVVLWRADRWSLVDAGRVKVVDDDRGYRLGEPFVWDRYVTWTVLQRQDDGAVVSVLSAHMPTNPVRYPAQPGGGSTSRLERYSRGMDILVQTVRTLGTLGPVLLGGDMNSHPYQGAWTAAQRMNAAGYGYVKDRAVMHLFHQPAVRVLAHREVRVDSDHPAIVTTFDMGGQGPTPGG
jgi:endonuclease/exonuclease/phosphatase (EEP) superfamily protein YafD